MALARCLRTRLTAGGMGGPINPAVGGVPLARSGEGQCSASEHSVPPLRPGSTAWLTTGGTHVVAKGQT
jgi:hypothetical protein